MTKIADTTFVLLHKGSKDPFAQVAGSQCQAFLKSLTPPSTIWARPIRAADGFDKAPIPTLADWLGMQAEEAHELRTGIVTYECVAIHVPGLDLKPFAKVLKGNKQRLNNLMREHKALLQGLADVPERNFAAEAQEASFDHTLMAMELAEPVDGPDSNPW